MAGILSKIDSAARASLVGVLLVASSVGTCCIATAEPASATASKYSQKEYATALAPVLAADAAHDGVMLTAADASCAADFYVQGFTLRRLRSIGSPTVVANEWAKEHPSYSLFGITKAEEAQIASTAFWRCLGIGRSLTLAFQSRGSKLSDTSAACLQSRFDADQKASDAYITAITRQLLGRPRVVTDGLVRSSIILQQCLTPAEQSFLRS
jgi:hypothetical protein